MNKNKKTSTPVDNLFTKFGYFCKLYRSDLNLNYFVLSIRIIKNDESFTQLLRLPFSRKLKTVIHQSQICIESFISFRIQSGTKS